MKLHEGAHINYKNRTVPTLQLLFYKVVAPLGLTFLLHTSSSEIKLLNKDMSRQVSLQVVRHSHP